MKHKIICPYYSSSTGKCVNKKMNKNRKGKRYCIYKNNPKKCKLYNELEELKKASQEA